MKKLLGQKHCWHWSKMEQVLKYFEEISKIPHCSANADGLKNYIVNFANENGFSVEVDDVKNIVCYKDKRNFALQCHYDMVCIGDAPKLELVKNGNILSAKNSSLGADNGIGVAMMLALMEEGSELEYVFSADEEIGLIGAKAIEIELKAQKMINIDSETEGDVYIGCAGGIDIPASIELDFIDIDIKNMNTFEVTVDGLPGGHSGIDIDKNTPNAIKLLSHWIYLNGAKIVSFEGGERRNSIARSAKAIVVLEKDFKMIDVENVKYFKIKSESKVIKQSSQIINMLHNFKHGVREFNEKIGVVQTSINLAQLFTKENRVEVALTARSMDNEDLISLAKETIKFVNKYGFNSTEEDYYSAWKPETSEFTEDVLGVMKKRFENAELKALHAGLECAVFKEKYPKMQIASIGPNIFHPHSDREYVELDSIDRVFSSLKSLVQI